MEETGTSEKPGKLLNFFRYVWIVFMFDYPVEGKDKAPGGLAIDSVWTSEHQADTRAAELKSIHHEAWVDGFPLDGIVQDVLITLDEGEVILHMAEEDVN